MRGSPSGGRTPNGGYWHRLDKADFSFVARGLRPAGAVTVVVNYGLIPTIDMDTLVRQCRSAVAWVSTSPPSASMTTFISTVARESSS